MTVRVLHVHSGNLYGGVESMLATFVRHQGLAPHLRNEFALCFDGRIRRELENYGSPVYDLGEVRVRRPLSMWRARKRLTNLLRARRFQVVVCQGAWTQAIFGSTVRGAGLPQVFWLHDPPQPRRHWLERWASSNSPDMVVCNSRYTLERLPRLYRGVPAEILYCPVECPDSANVEQRAHLRSQYGVREDECVILQVGRLERHKGHLLHLEALAKLPPALPWRLWCVVGVQRSDELSYRHEIEAAAQRLGIQDRIHLFDWVPNIQPFFAAADVYCQPNTGPEPFGISYIEAMYAGRPVVSTALGGPVETIHESCGFLTEPGNASALAEALRYLITHPERREALGACGKVRAAALCNPESQLNRLQSLLEPLARLRLAS